MSVYRNADAPRRAKQARLLATTGLATLMLAALTVHPAHAAMTVTTGGSVTGTSNTATTATTNTNGANASSLDRIQLWNNGTPITANTGNFTITGNGLALEETGATPATINIINGKSITSTAASGIGLLLLGNGGDITYTYGGTATTAVSGATGLEATNLLSGKITLTTPKSIAGTAGDGIDTSAVNGDTLLTIAGGTTKGFTGFTGINAAATGSGNLDVEITAGTVGTTTSTGIVLNQTGTGSNTITNSGTITGAGTGANPVIAIATTNAGSTTITNNNRLLAQDASGLAILSTVTTGADHIVNASILTGEIYLSNQSNTLTNSGTWSAQDNTGTGYNAAAFGTSGLNSLTNGGTINAGNFTAPTASTFTGIQTIDNSGTINAGLYGPGDVTSFIAGGAFAQTVNNTGTINVNGTANFEGNGTFNNAGLIDMRTVAGATAYVTALNMAVSDNTYTPGAAYDFAGGANSQLGLDAILASTPSAGSDVLSGRLLISGAASGTTGILIDDISGTTGWYNPDGITLVAVNGASTDAFTLQGVTVATSGVTDLLQPLRGPMGAIKKGFWFYPLLQTPHAIALADGLTGADSTEYRLFGLPDVEAFQTPLATTGAENIWYDTAIGWSQRQDELRKHWTHAYGSADAYGSGKFNFWAKATGNWDKRTNTNSLNPYAPAPGLLPNLDTSFDQNTYSAQLGTDVGFNDVLGKDGVLMLGMSAGYLDSTLKFKTSSNQFDYSGATIAANVDYLHGGFFWDTALKADFLQTTLSYNSLAYFGVSQQAIEADTWGALSSAGYHIGLDGHGTAAAFLEPMLTVAYTSTNAGSLTSLGMTTNFNDSTTFRGALGARLGGQLAGRGGMIVDASITGNYWNEFTNDTSVTFLSASDPALSLSDARQKGYGEVTGQVNVTNNTGWSGFLDGGAKFNSQSTSIELSGGIAFKW